MNVRVRSVLRFLVVLVTLWLVLALCTGCSLRETNKSLQQAGQAVEGAQHVLAAKVAPAVASLPPDLQEAVKQALDQVCQLMTSARESIQPALIVTAGNEPPPVVDTTVQEAIERPAEFTRKAAKQVGRALVEVERVGWWLQVGAVALAFGQAAAGDWLSVLLLALGGGTGAAALAAKGVQVFRRLKAATTDAVAFGNDMAQATTDDDARAVIKHHKVRQEHNGTRKVIQQAGARSTAPPPTA